jgi:hypothetical protein
VEETISIAASRFCSRFTLAAPEAWFLKIVQEKQYRNAILHFSTLSNMEV